MISIGETIDEFYEGKVRAESIKQRGSDVLRLLTTAEAHIKKKIANQQTDLSACEEMGKWKLYGDLITANLYRIEKSQRSVECENYYSESGETVRIPLDYRLTPAQNAQKYYKKYNKAKTAKTELTRRIELSRAELEYIYTVFESLAKAEGEEDFSQIRQELYENGYASKMKDYKKCKQQRPKPMKFTTDGGYTVYVERTISKTSISRSTQHSAPTGFSISRARRAATSLWRAETKSRERRTLRRRRGSRRIIPQSAREKTSTWIIRGFVTSKNPPVLRREK